MRARGCLTNANHRSPPRGAINYARTVAAAVIRKMELLKYSPRNDDGTPVTFSRTVTGGGGVRHFSAGRSTAPDGRGNARKVSSIAATFFRADRRRGQRAPRRFRRNDKFPLRRWPTARPPPTKGNRIPGRRVVADNDTYRDNPVEPETGHRVDHRNGWSFRRCRFVRTAAPSSSRIPKIRAPQPPN